MKSLTIPSSGTFIKLMIAAGFAFMLVVPALGQATRTLNTVARRIEDFNQQSRQVARDEMNREMRPQKPTAEQLRKAKAIEALIEQDLTALQTEYNNIVTRLQSNTVIADDFAAESAGRVNKHAERLRGNIAFPKPAEDEKAAGGTAATGQTTRRSLIELCTRILGFFDSPIFASLNVLDIAGATEARRKLDGVIILSAEVKAGPK